MTPRKDIPYDEALKRARRMATVFGVLVIVALISFVYAYFQKESADRMRITIEAQKKELNEYKARAEKLELDASLQLKAQQASAMEISKQLDECRNSKAKK